MPSSQTYDSMNQLGWVLIHFVWEGAVIGVISGIALRILRKSSAQARYIILCGALFACGLAPLFTITFVERGTQAQFTSTSGRDGKFPVTPVALLFNSGTKRDSDRVSFPAEQTTPEISLSRERASSAVQSAIPYFVILWSVGVCFFSTRLLWAWIRLQFLCASGTPLEDAYWIERTKALADRMGVHRIILMIESTLVEVPTVIGWLRPVILVPIAFFTSLSPNQVEAILAHEIAHIRRQDYLVNLVQIIIETVFFYHPVVWWISHAVRKERENCCDDIALQIIGDKAIYLDALVSLEESRSSPIAITLAATGGSLLQRIRRLAVTNENSASVRRRPLFYGLLVPMVAALLAVSWIIVTESITDARLISALNQGFGLKSNDFKSELDLSQSRINAAFDKRGKSLLDLAAERGLENEALLLLLAGADPNLKDAAGKTPIYYSLDHPSYNQAMIRDFLLLRGAKLDVTDENGLTPLMTAVKSADLNSVAALLRWGADRNPPAMQGELFRKIVQDRGDPKITELLQNFVPGLTKAQLNRAKPLQQVQDAFVTAATKGNLAEMDDLLRQGATVDGNASDGVPAIHRAVSYQQEDAVVYLLELGANPDARDNASYPPLSYAFGWHGPTSNYMQMAMIAAGAHTDMVQATGYNLLADACSHDNLEGEQWMIWTGNDPSKACPAGTPMYISSKAGLSETIKLLQHNGVTEPPYTDPSPRWQMMRAVKAGDIPAIQRLLDRGTPVDLPLQSSGDDGLMVAIAYRQLDVARYLLKHGAAPNYQNHGGATPLNITVGWFYPENEKFREELLDAGANPNLPDNQGMTPFICACVYGDLNPKITQMLSHGANINQRDNEGHTGLYYAQRSGRSEAAEYLLQHGATKTEVNAEIFKNAWAAPSPRMPVGLANVPIDSGLPDDMRSIALQAADDLKGERYDAAVAGYENILKTHPLSVYAWSNLGVTQFQQKNYEGARNSFEHALLLSPGDRFDIAELGMVYLQMNLFEDANLAIKTAIVLDPNNGGLHNLLGLIYQKIGLSHEADAEFAIAANFEKQNVNVDRALTAPSLSVGRNGLQVQYLSAHIRIERAERDIQADHSRDVRENVSAALAELRAIQTSDPDWKSGLIKRKIEEATAILSKIKSLEMHQNDNSVKGAGSIPNPQER